MKIYYIRFLSSRLESRQRDADVLREAYMYAAKIASPRRFDGSSVEAVRQTTAC